MKRTKIVCTLGPASQDVSTIAEMVRSGMNAARINLSHGTPEEHRRLIQTVRQVATGLGVPKV